jgi:hypothetical protein
MVWRFDHFRHGKGLLLWRWKSVLIANDGKWHGSMILGLGIYRI